MDSHAKQNELNRLADTALESYDGRGKQWDALADAVENADPADAHRLIVVRLRDPHA